MPGEFDDSEVVLEVDGAGVHPDNVDAVAFLEAATSYFLLLQRAAAERGEDLPLRGVRIVDKCAAISTRADSPAAAKRAALHGLAILDAQEPPQGLALLVRRFRASLEAVGPGFRVVVRAGDLERRLVLNRAEAVDFPQEATSMRARVLRVGGKEPKVTLESASESSAFSLLVSEDDAQGLARSLYRFVDAEVVLRRNARGAIEEGRVVSFEPVEDGASLDAWRVWFKSAGADFWNDVDDVEAELGHD